MVWHDDGRDDAWRDSYDAWKLASPDDDYEEDRDCDHEDYEADILTGRATCNRCHHNWYQTQDEVNAEIERTRQYDKWQRRQQRREFWRKLTLPIRWPIFRLLDRFWPRHACDVLTDDEIPF